MPTHAAVTMEHMTTYKFAGLCWYSRASVCSFVARCSSDAFQILFACLRIFWDVVMLSILFLDVVLFEP
jgi:hypothetical protein